MITRHVGKKESGPELTFGLQSPTKEPSSAVDLLVVVRIRPKELLAALIVHLVLLIPTNHKHNSNTNQHGDQLNGKIHQLLANSLGLFLFILL